MNGPDDDDGVQTFLYLLAFGVCLFLIRLFGPKLFEALPERVGSAVAMLLPAGFLGVIVFLWWVYVSATFDAIRASVWRMVAVGLVSAGLLAFVGFMGLEMYDVIFGPPRAAGPPTPPPDPKGMGTAIAGGVVLLISLFYFWAVTTKEDGSWGERFLDLKVFVIWFGAGCVLIILSGVFDAAIARAVGPEFGGRLAGMSEERVTTVAIVGAALLATVVSLWADFTRR